MEEDIIKDCNNKLIELAKKNIIREQNGFVVSGCKVTINGILIHSLQNKDIFNKHQLVNINDYLNKAVYG